MKRNLITALLTSILVIGTMFAGLVFLSKKEDKTKQEEQVAMKEELDMIDEETGKGEQDLTGAIPLTWTGKNPNVVVYSDTTPDEIYNVKKSQEMKQRLDKLKMKKKYTIGDPMVVKNPYGTNELSLYIYFEADKNTYVKATVHIPDKSTPDFTRTLYNSEKNNLTKKHEYQLIGLIPGKENYIILRLYNEQDKLLKKVVYKIKMDSLKSPVSTKLKETKGKSEEAMSNGLFFILGNDANNTKSPNVISAYDNSGYLRGVIPLKAYRTDRIVFIEEDMLYSYDYDRFALVSRLGQVMKTYHIAGYRQHHDFTYNGYGQLWILATESGNKNNTVEDVIVSLDLKTGKAKKLLDFKDLMGDIWKKAKKAEDKQKLDWIHFNSISMIGSNSIVLSSRELSGIIKVDNVTSKQPTIRYIISEPTLWSKTKYTKLLLSKALMPEEEAKKSSTPESSESPSMGKKEKKEELFLSQFGQHTVTYQEDPSLPEGQYYLYMFNNNFGFSSTRPSIDYSKYKGIGIPGKEAKNSMYYKYLVDENAGTYALADSVLLPYSRIVSSTQEVGSNKITNSGVAHILGEYDKKGKAIYEFSYPSETYTYRIFKYNMKKFWFQ